MAIYTFILLFNILYKIIKNINVYFNDFKKKINIVKYKNRQICIKNKEIAGVNIGTSIVYNLSSQVLLVLSKNQISVL